MELRTYCALIWFEAVAVGIGANDSTAEMDRASDIAASSREGLLVIMLFRWFVQMLTSERNKANTGKNERARRELLPLKLSCLSANQPTLVLGTYV